jgi:hypothetical protein
MYLLLLHAVADFFFAVSLGCVDSCATSHSGQHAMINFLASYDSTYDTICLLLIVVSWQEHGTAGRTERGESNMHRLINT